MAVCAVILVIILILYPFWYQYNVDCTVSVQRMPIEQTQIIYLELYSAHLSVHIGLQTQIKVVRTLKLDDVSPIPP